MRILNNFQKEKGQAMFDYQTEKRKKMIGQMVQNANPFTRDQMIECAIKYFIYGAVFGAVAAFLLAWYMTPKIPC